MILKKKLALAIFLVLAAVFGTVYAVAAYTAPLEFTPRKAVLTAERGTVEIRRAGSENWTTVSTAAEVHEGDSIRTGNDSAATIDYFEQGQARLDAETTITLEKLQWDPEHPTTFVGEVFLESGRLWSRLLDFLTPESAYVAKTANTVATVRGTAFALSNIPKGYEGVFVAEHQVDVSVREGDAIIKSMEARQGITARIDRNPKSKTPITTKEDAWDEQERDWIGQNLPLDVAYDAKVAKDRLAEARGMISAKPGTLKSKLVDAAESIKMAITFDEREEGKLRERFMARKMLTAFVAADEGRTEEAKALMAGIHRDEKMKMGTDMGMAVTFMAQQPVILRNDVIDVLNDVAPGAADVISRVKTRRLKFELLGPLKFVPPKIERIIEVLPERIDEKPIINSNTNVPLPIPKKPEPLVNQPVNEPPAPAPVTAVSLKVTADARNLVPGGRTTLRAQLVMSDGTAGDVTSNVRWSTTPDSETGKQVGTIEGNLFIANNDGGKTFVTAVFNNVDGTFQGTVDITVLLLEF